MSAWLSPLQETASRLWLIARRAKPNPRGSGGRAPLDLT
jgi:hypothetical protein